MRNRQISLTHKNPQFLQPGRVSNGRERLRIPNFIFQVILEKQDCRNFLPNVQFSSIGDIKTCQTDADEDSRQGDNPVAEARNMEQAKALLAKGYKYEMDYDGVKLFTKK